MRLFKRAWSHCLYPKLPLIPQISKNSDQQPYKLQDNSDCPTRQSAAIWPSRLISYKEFWKWHIDAARCKSKTDVLLSLQGYKEIKATSKIWLETPHNSEITSENMVRTNKENMVWWSTWLDSLQVKYFLCLPKSRLSSTQFITMINEILNTTVH